MDTYTVKAARRRLMSHVKDTHRQGNTSEVTLMDTHSSGNRLKADITLMDTHSQGNRLKLIVTLMDTHSQGNRLKLISHSWTHTARGTG